MKKEYIQPSIKARKVYPTQMICQSTFSTYSDETVSTALGKQSSWDEDEEDY